MTEGTTRSSRIIAAVVCGALLAGVAAAAPAPPTPKPEVQRAPVAGGQIPTLCADLKASITATKAIVNGNGVITVHGKVCNLGPGVFKVPAGSSPAGVLMVYTWHPPKTPAQEGDVKDFGSKPITANLAKGQCVDMDFVYNVPNVIQWGHRTPQPGERKTSRQFVLRIDKFYPPQVGPFEFTPAEDCNLDNNRAVLPNIDSMEKTP